eukprot:gene11547-13480_t
MQQHGAAAHESFPPPPPPPFHLGSVSPVTNNSPRAVAPPNPFEVRSSPILASVPYSPIPSPRGITLPTFLSITPDSCVPSHRDLSPRNHSPRGSYRDLSPRANRSSPLLDSSNGSVNNDSDNEDGLYYHLSCLLPLCSDIDQEKIGQRRSTMLTSLQDQLGEVMKQVAKAQTAKPPRDESSDQSNDSRKDYYDLRPRRNRKSHNKAKEHEMHIKCQRCGAKDSPEWRKGPDGTKSLCNACGLYYAKTKKKEMALVGSQSNPNIEPTLMNINHLINNDNNNDNNDNNNNNISTNDIIFTFNNTNIGNNNNNKKTNNQDTDSDGSIDS